MKELASLKVVSFTRHHVPNAHPDGDLSWQTYHTVRNAVVRTCQRYGPTGPMGIIKIDPGAASLFPMLAEDPEAWEPGAPDPMYFVLDDQHNHERYLYAELYGDDPFNPGWLHSVTETLREFSGWGLGISNIPDSYILIFGKRLMVKGRLSRCRSVPEVIETARRLLKRGSKRWWQFWR